MSVRDLVVRPGDRVSLAGRYLRVDEQDWLDLARVVAAATPPNRKSNKAIRVVGLNPALVPKDFGPANNLIRGWARVTGIWHGDSITVDSQDTVDRPPHYEPMCLACPPPPGGWDTTNRSTDVPELDSLCESGAIVRYGWLQEGDSEAIVLRVAASDVELVHRVLDPRLPRRLCVVASLYSAHDVRRLVAGLHANFGRCDFDTTSVDLTAEGQPIAHVVLLRITEEFAEWADTFPPGLLHLEPTITPA